MVSVPQVIYKVVLLGDQHVGKSSLMERYVHNRYSPHYIKSIGKGLITPWSRYYVILELTLIKFNIDIRLLK